MDTVTLVIALLGVGLALGSLAWQICSWRLTYATRVSVELSRGELILGERTIDVLSVAAINKSAHAVSVDQVVFGHKHSKKRFIAVSYPYVFNNLPGEVLPRGGAASHYAVESFAQADIDLSLPLVVWLRLATGKTISSKPVSVSGGFNEL
jgi:hypothetical protein